MANSSLVSCTVLSPNHSGKRTMPIDRISIHCMAGNLSVESCGSLFAKSSREASSNYGIGSDGRIGLYVDEANRSWCTSSRANDQRAITIEVANTVAAHPWPVSDKAYNALIDLLVDICKRNNKNKLVWFSDKDTALAYEPKAGEIVFTVHRWFAAKACPGDYLYDRHGEIVAEVTKRLSGTTAATTTDEGKTEDKQTATILYRVQVGAYSKRKNAEKELEKLKAAGFSAIIVETVPATDSTSEAPAAFKAYLVRIDTDVLNIRKGASTDDPVVGNVKRNGVYTIVEENDGWGKLKSGAGWIYLPFTVRV